MLRHTAREWSDDDFDAWMAATDEADGIAAAADEEGGPRLSLVPPTERQEPWPTDLLPPAADAATPISPEPDAAPIAAEPFDGVALTDSRKRRAGWSAERQRIFLGALAETGSVHLASAAARLTARSAHRLRARSQEFAAAWATAEQLAAGRLAALAFDRAIHGRIEQTWRGGDLISERRLPSDQLLMWLLARLDPQRFAAPSERRDGTADPQATARLAFPDQLADLSDEASD